MTYIKSYKEWLENPYFDEETKKELLSIENNEKEIEDRFYKNLEFGTGGLRGVIGAGTNRINKYTVRRATYGLANYILNKCGEEGKQKGVVIAYDSRFKSEEFSNETAKTLAACGIKAYIFDSLRTTPQLSFAVRHLGCVAGVVITASHNPPEYNGYKVYWTDGGQVCPNIAEEIIQEVNKIEDYSTIPTTNEDNELITLLDEKVDRAFIDAVKEQVIRQDIIDKVGKDMKIIFTPIHGTGNLPIRNVLDEVGFKNVAVVKEQEMPDPKFSTVEYPNPEEKAVFDIAISMAKENGADIIIGTDPDCDRVGVVVKNNEGEYVVLNGNQVGSLLVDYVISNKIDEIKTNYNQGSLVETENQTDFAINGKGFFTVRDNEGNLFYTRDGAFKVNRDGYLVTSSGYSVLNSNNQPIYVGNSSVSVDTNNNVVLSSGAVHRFNIVDFQDYNSLNKVGSNLYTGEGATATNNYTVKNMQIEGSNVDIIQSTADLMSNLRAFEANQKVVQIMDSTLSKIANEIGTVR